MRIDDVVTDLEVQGWAPDVEVGYCRLVFYLLN
jgi:hypothetical protein